MRQRRRLGAEVGAVRAAKPARVSVLALGATVVWLREIRRATGNDAPVRSEDFVRFVGNHLLAAVQLHRRKKLAVGKLRHSLVRAVNAGVSFDVVVPRRDVGVANRPVYCDALPGVRLEVEIAMAIALATPHQ